VNASTRHTAILPQDATKPGFLPAGFNVAQLQADLNDVAN